MRDNPTPEFEIDRYAPVDNGIFSVMDDKNIQKPKDSTRVTQAYTLFKAYLEGNRLVRDAAQEAQNIYDGKQYDDAAKAKLISDGRAPVVFNFVKDKVKAMLGMLMQRPFRFKCNPGMGNGPNKAHYLNELYLRDRDLGDWDYSEMEFIKDFLIHTGCLVMFQDDKADPFGHINLMVKSMSQVIYDPDWTTSDEDDNENIYLIDWMSPDEMKNKFGDQIEEIRQAVERYEQYKAANYNSSEVEERISGYDRSSECYNKANGKYLVVEQLHLNHIKKLRKYNRKTGAWFDEQPEEIQGLIQDAISLGVVPQDEWAEIESPHKELESLIFCPALSLTESIFDGLHDIQIKSYPLVISSADNSHGFRSGMVADYIDPQKLFNSTHSMFMNWQQTVTSGVEFIDASKFQDSGEAQRYVEEGNIPGSVFYVKDLNNAVKSKERPNAPIDFKSTMDSAVSYMEKVGPPPASLGLSEGDSESGVLYNAKRQQSFIKTTGYTASLKRCTKRLGTMYVSFTPKAYGDDVPRYWTNKKQEEVGVNLSFDDQSNLTDVGRISVSVVDGPVTNTVKEEAVALFYQVKQSTQDSLIQARLDDLIGKNLPGLDEQELEDYRKSTRLAVDMNTKKYGVMLLQYDQQYQQMLSMVNQAGTQQGMMASQGQNPGQQGGPGAPQGTPPPQLGQAPVRPQAVPGAQPKAASPRAIQGAQT